MAQSLEDRKIAAVERLMAIDAARRGQLSQQYYERTSADGQTRQQGPYYVWQRYVKGQKHSVRVPRDQVARVEAELERGAEVDAIIEDIWTVFEQTAQEEDQDRKKKPMRSRPRANARPRRPSI